jgi:hypothetical protein
MITQRFLDARLVILPGLLVFAACRSESAVFPESGPPYSIEALSVQTTSGVVGEPVAIAPRIRVWNSDHRPVARVPVAFRASAGGTVANANTTTDQSGIATASIWRLGENAALENDLDVQVAGAVSIRFTAVAHAGPPLKLVPVTANQIGAVGDFVTPPAVKIVDRFENTVAGIQVTFSTDGDAGSLGNLHTISSSDGIASAGSWRLGSSPGLQEVTAASPGIPSVRFSAVAYDGSRYDFIGIQTDSSVIPITARSSLMMTDFDPCLCKSAGGYFFAVDDNQDFGLDKFHGTYAVSGDSLVFTGEPFSTGYILTFTARLKGDLLLRSFGPGFMWVYRAQHN